MSSFATAVTFHEVWTYPEEPQWNDDYDFSGTYIYNNDTGKVTFVTEEGDYTGTVAGKKLTIHNYYVTEEGNHTFTKQ